VRQLRRHERLQLSEEAGDALVHGDVSFGAGETAAADAEVDGLYRIQSLGRYGIGTVELTVTGGRLSRPSAVGRHHAGVCRYNPASGSIDIQLDSRHLAPDLLPAGNGEIIAFSVPWARLSHSVALELAGAPLILCIRRAGPIPAADARSGFEPDCLNAALVSG
jgi:hypothetical protein